MESNKTRSPYIVTVTKLEAESGIAGANLQLFIPANEETLPTDPTYILEKSPPASNLPSLSFDLSRYIRDKIVISDPQYEASVTVVTGLWKKIQYLASNLTASDRIDKYFTLGWSKYVDGLNKANPTTVLLNEGTYYYHNKTGVEAPQIYFIPDAAVVTFVRYTNLSTGATLTRTATEGQRTKLCVVSGVVLTYFAVGNKVELVRDSEVVWTATFKPQSECKYQVHQIEFLNRFGVWQMTHFYKAKKQNFSTKKDVYNLKSGSVNYNQKLGQRRIMEVNGQDSITLNSGWVAENYSEILDDMFLTTELLLDGVPAMVKQSSLNVQSDLVDGLINYEIQFEYRFDKMNSVK